MTGPVIVITGAMASGKSTVAELLARRLPRSVHLRGDQFRTMIVNGRVEMTENATAEATSQLRLRYRLAAQAADTCANDGFTVVLQDVIVGSDLRPFLDLVQTPDRYLVMLTPQVDVLRRRDEARSKTGYHSFDPTALDRVVREQTPRLGLWLDSSEQTPIETASAILDRLEQARV